MYILYILAILAILVCVTIGVWPETASLIAQPKTVAHPKTDEEAKMVARPTAFLRDQRRLRNQVGGGALVRPKTVAMNKHGRGPYQWIDDHILFLYIYIHIYIHR